MASAFDSVPRIARESTAEQVADQIRELILSGALKPGEQLKEAQIAGAFDTSRNTVRESLLLLANAGVVQRVRNRGACVTAYGPDDVRELTHARRVLELSAVDVVEANPDLSLSVLEQALDELRTAEAHHDWNLIPLADAAFHRALVSLHDNHRIMSLYDQLQTEIRLTALISGRQDASQDQPVLDEHQRVYDHLFAGDFKAARNELARMILETQQRLLHAEAFQI